MSKDDLEWLHRFINCAVFGPPASECQRAHRIVEDLAARPEERPSDRDILMRFQKWTITLDQDGAREFWNDIAWLSGCGMNSRRELEQLPSETRSITIPEPQEHHE